ncbi:MAG: RodZ domain-containing protein [Pseudomonadota bacterium]
MELRGFDDYEVTLGDRVRGERASLGKSLDDVERELHIKASLIQSIEDCDLEGFPNHSVVSGYVRSYARYLGLNQDAFYGQFCKESGFVSPNAGLTDPERRPAEGPSGHGRRLAGSPFDQSRFAPAPARSRFTARISLGAVASAMAMVALVAGIGYGGYAVFQNVQRVGFAPLPDAPEVGAEPPLIAAMPETDDLRPSAEAYSSGALAAVFAEDDEPPIRRRDGPISAIDPGSAGLFDREVPRITLDLRPDRPEVDSADDAIRVATAQIEAEQRMALRLAAATRRAEDEARVPAVLPKGLMIRVVEEAWIRVRSDTGAVIFEGILPAGQSYALPERVSGGQLRAGNAGAVYILLDGTPFGPVGRPGGVAKGVDLSPTAVRAAYAPAVIAPGTVSGLAERQASAQ